MKRILLKLSGESLSGKQGFGLDPEAVLSVCNGIKDLVNHGIEVAVVIGGGNLFRGSDGKKMELARVSADHMGMLATIMNGICLKEVLQGLKVDAVCMSAIGCDGIVERFHAEKAKKELEDKKVVICVGGTGNSFFT
ncbi:MAG TPA: UMP kinase, partial [Chlamydiales bacterium]|nr:UMP kinase [Chlamydiales bacterium]